MHQSIKGAIDRVRIVAPGSGIGILGDGQLGKMLALAAGALGYRVSVLGPVGRASPAGQVSSSALAWEAHVGVSEALLNEFCAGISVVLVEWENVPVSLVQRIEAQGIRVCCGSSVLEIAQDRIKEKRYAELLGIPTPKFFAINSDNYTAGYPIAVTESYILKTCRDGYDGKGQIHVNVGESVYDAWAQLKHVPCILESRVDFAYEVSVIVARSPQGMVCYGPFINSHEHGILRTSVYPGNVSKFVKDNALTVATVLARELDVHGLLAVEMFAMKDGRVLFNEMAPRPHNSGHLTIECCDTSQFEQHVRAACNIPLGSVLFHSRGEMTNILGNEVEGWYNHLAKPGTSLHLYGKGAPREGRKMGHVTRRWNTSDRVRS